MCVCVQYLQWEGKCEGDSMLFDYCESLADVKLDAGVYPLGCGLATSMEPEY